MNELAEILAELEKTSLSSISEIEGQKSLTAQEFKKLIKNQIVVFNEQYNLKPGQNVILKASNTINFFIDFLALYFMNIMIIPIDPSINGLEIEALAKKLTTQLILGDDGVVECSGEIRKDFSGIALMLLTSGSTSSPKGVLISKNSLELKFKELEKNIETNAMEKTLCFVPTFFGHGLICNCLFPIFFGQHLLLASKMTIDLAKTFNLFLESHQITFFSSVPSHWEMILNLSEKYQGNSVKRVHCASAPLNETKAKKIAQWLGKRVELYDVYGATEMLGWFATRRVFIDRAMDGFSEFWNLESKISDEGELLLKSDYMFSGYWADGQTQNHNFFNTGDIFSNGQITGRTKNVINKNGIKIQTEEINHLILQSSMVDSAAAFPISDEFTGERIGLLVVLRHNHTLSELWEYCKKNIHANKIPSEIIPVKEIPTSNRGKILPKKLTEMHICHQEVDREVLAIFNQIFKTNSKSCDIERESVANWDSMRHAELIIKLQNQFKIQFKAKDILNIQNLNELIGLVKAYRLDSF